MFGRWKLSNPLLNRIFNALLIDVQYTLLFQGTKEFWPEVPSRQVAWGVNPSHNDYNLVRNLVPVTSEKP